jgi:hypothetical protein
LHALLRLLRGLQFGEQLIPLFRYGNHLLALRLFLLFRGGASLFSRSESLLQLSDFSTQGFLLFRVGAVRTGDFLKRLLGQRQLTARFRFGALGLP